MTSLVDIHHHLIHGLDDGAQTFEDTQAMLRTAYKNGVKVIAATLHVTPGIKPVNLTVYGERLAMAQRWSDDQGLGIRICFGSEIFYTQSTERLLVHEYIPTLNGTNKILVEFNPDETYSKIKDAVRRLGNAGYTVIIAHAERYDALKKIKNIVDLKERLAALIQINASTVLSPGGFWQKLWLKRVMKQRLCDVIATDAHNVSSRNCRMKACYELLKRDYGTKMADNLCISTPAAILNLNHINN